MQEWVVVPRQVRTVHGKQTVHYFRKARRPFSVAFWDFFFGACQWIDWHSAKLEREHPHVFGFLMATFFLGCIILCGLIEGSE